MRWRLIAVFVGLVLIFTNWCGFVVLFGGFACYDWLGIML